MAGTVTATEELSGAVKKVIFDWLTDASGDATKSTTNGINGIIQSVIFVPDTSATQPSDQYDVTILDDSSIDLLNGQGLNLSNVNTVVLVDNFNPIPGNKLNLVVDNGGNAKGGVVYVYIVEA
jgi:hypothetical protein